ncbi:MAG: hypothetical protein PHT58_00865 [Eubacteriales bacterium]|nr:hypothetical protein [Eubacteriales bacterium]
MASTFLTSLLPLAALSSTLDGSLEKNNVTCASHYHTRTVIEMDLGKITA